MAAALGDLLPLPVGVETLRMAGNYFYYDTLKARLELGMDGACPAQQAIEEAYAWYRNRGFA
jgi:hypothetical protein